MWPGTCLEGLPDANILVSAFATRGVCADVLRVVLTFVTSEVVLRELTHDMPQLKSK
jgi:hypothetical protein